MLKVSFIFSYECFIFLYILINYPRLLCVRFKTGEIAINEILGYSSPSSPNPAEQTQVRECPGLDFPPAAMILSPDGMSSFWYKFTLFQVYI